MITWLQDLRCALRQLRKSPSFTVAAVLTLAMAIGANVVVFSVLKGVILRPLNVPQPESLYLLESASDKNTAQSYPDYLDFRDRNHSFDGLAHSEWVKWPSMQVTVRQLNGTSRPAVTILTRCAFSRISADFSMTPMIMGQTALHIWCSATTIGTVIFMTIAEWWAVWPG